MSSLPSSSIGAQSRSAPFSRATWYQGTTFEWCSISVTTMRSLGARLALAHEYATRLRASVALRTKTTSRRSAPRCEAIVCLASS
jgi:hypothetical protein